MFVGFKFIGTQMGVTAGNALKMCQRGGWKGSSLEGSLGHKVFFIFLGG